MSSATPAVFDAEAMKKRVVELTRAAFFQAIPDDVLLSMVAEQVQAFFKEDSWVRVGTVKMSEKNPHYDSTRPSSNWGANNPHREVEHLAITRAMSPFRQLVWTELNELVCARTQEVLDKLSSDVNTDLGKLVSEELDASVKTIASGKIHTMAALFMSKILTDTINLAHTQTRAELVNALKMNGIVPPGTPL